MKSTYLAISIVLLLLSSCGNNEGLQPDTFADKDMCIFNTDGHKVAVCYGDKQKDVEEVLGTGNAGGFNELVNYDNGVSIFYRDETVAGIGLDEESDMVYETPRGSVIGLTKEQIKELYGNTYAIDESERNLDYAYDDKAGEFITGGSRSDRVKAKESVYLASFTFDNAGKVSRVVLIDGKMANTLS